MKLENKVALVTGAAKRVGRAIALGLAERGVKLALHYKRSAKEARALAAEIEREFGTRALIFQADLGDVGQISRLPREVAKRLGGLHILVNNASVYKSNIFGRTSRIEWDLHMDTNLRAPFFLSQAAAPYLKKGGDGVIVNIADWSALRPYADYIPYCISKAGLLCLNTALAKALAPEIRVNAIMPGPVLLPQSYSRGMRETVRRATPLKRLGEPEDVVRSVLYLLEFGDFVTGAALAVDGGRLIA